MSKKRSKKHDRIKRDLKTIANLPPRRLLYRPQLSVLSAVEDFRRPPTFPITTSYTYHRTTGDTVQPSFRRPRFPLAFDLRLPATLPPEAVVCVRRKIRREVILAKGYGVKTRKYRTSEKSKIHCKR